MGFGGQEMPPRAGAPTREKILDASEGLILEQGYAGTSIDQIIDAVGMTKGTFFYHFKTKNDLARALIERFAAADARLLRENLERAEKLSTDPLQQILVFVGLFLEMAEGLEEPYPGCLFASYCYESGHFDEETMAVVERGMLAWREALGAKLREAAEAHPPRAPVHLDSLADMMTVVFEGAFILSRTLKEPRAFAEQLRHYRQYLELLFA
jgi:TetR/AcrR family transcriptional repressor of nem operon